MVELIFEALIGQKSEIKCSYWSKAGQTRKKRPRLPLDVVLRFGCHLSFFRKCFNIFRGHLSKKNIFAENFSSLMKTFFLFFTCNYLRNSISTIVSEYSLLYCPYIVTIKNINFGDILFFVYNKIMKIYL